VSGRLCFTLLWCHVTPQSGPVRTPSARLATCPDRKAGGALFVGGTAGDPVGQ